MKTSPVISGAAVIFGLFMGLTGPMGAASAQSFKVTNGRAATELSESTRLYLNEKLVARFQLDEAHSRMTHTITPPSGQTELVYDLCGEITVIGKDGKKETHLISNRGKLHNPGGAHFMGLATKDFRTFYLADPKRPGAAEFTPGHSPLCSGPIS